MQHRIKYYAKAKTHKLQIMDKNRWRTLKRFYACTDAEVVQWLENFVKYKKSIDDL